MNPCTGTSEVSSGELCEGLPVPRTTGPPDAVQIVSVCSRIALRILGVRGIAGECVTEETNPELSKMISENPTARALWAQKKEEEEGMNE